MGQECGERYRAGTRQRHSAMHPAGSLCTTLSTCYFKGLGRRFTPRQTGRRVHQLLHQLQARSACPLTRPHSDPSPHLTAPLDPCLNEGSRLPSNTPPLTVSCTPGECLDSSTTVQTYNRSNCARGTWTSAYGWWSTGKMEPKRHHGAKATSVQHCFTQHNELFYNTTAAQLFKSASLPHPSSQIGRKNVPTIVPSHTVSVIFGIA
eukprot:23681-Rhodomonas_salina.2